MSLKRLEELKDGDINVHTRFTILNIGTHDINTKDGPKKILGELLLMRRQNSL